MSHFSEQVKESMNKISDVIRSAEEKLKIWNSSQEAEFGDIKWSPDPHLEPDKRRFRIIHKELNRVLITCPFEVREQTFSQVIGLMEVVKKNVIERMKKINDETVQDILDQITDA